MVKDQELKLGYVEDEILIYLVNEFQPHIRCTLGDMIPPKQGSNLFHNLVLNK